MALTDTQMLELAKDQYANALRAEQYKIGPRELRRAAIERYRAEIQYWTRVVSRNSDSTGGFATASFGDPI
jgi:hypothetical protein